MRRSLALVFCVSLINHSAGASTLGFDTLQPKLDMDRPIANGYGGFLWPSFKLFEGAWYTNGMVSPANVAVGTSSSYIYSGNLFDFNSAALTAANASGTLIRVQGLVGTNVTYDNTYIIKTNAPTAIQFNYLGINRVNFLVTNSMFIMDNVIANIQCATHCSNYVISWHLAVNPDCPFPSNVVAVAAGYQHSLFLKGDSTVAACGSSGIYCQAPL